MKEKVKGLGDTALISLRGGLRAAQGWEALVWFVDGKTAGALKDLGLPEDGESVLKLVEDSGPKNAPEDFALVLERALGVVLKGKQSEVS